VADLTQRQLAGHLAGPSGLFLSISGIWPVPLNFRLLPSQELKEEEERDRRLEEQSSRKARARQKAAAELAAADEGPPSAAAAEQDAVEAADGVLQKQREAKEFRRKVGALCCVELPTSGSLGGGGHERERG
jgi:hypothetical protein